VGTKTTEVAELVKSSESGNEGSGTYQKKVPTPNQHCEQILESFSIASWRG
jgi:hypothetical protein